MIHPKLREEFKRVFETLIVTDPADSKYQMVLRSFECLDGIGASINDFLNVEYDATPNGDCNEDCADCPNCEQTAENVTPFPTPVPEPHSTEEEKEESESPAPKAEEEKPTLTAAEVRSRLAEARRNGVNVAAIIKEFGADNFTALPATKYADLLDRIATECGGME